MDIIYTDHWMGSDYTAEHFDEWFNPDTYDWMGCGHFLAEFHSDKFDKWWNPEKYGIYNHHVLAKYCHENFNKWWDPEGLDTYQKSIDALPQVTHRHRLSTSLMYKNLRQYCLADIDVWHEPLCDTFLPGMVSSKQDLICRAMYR